VALGDLCGCGENLFGVVGEGVLVDPKRGPGGGYGGDHVAVQSSDGGSTGVDYAEGIKLTDPRRMAVYFAKYGTGGAKEYQHRVPSEWLTFVLVCEDCGTECEEDRDECPACGCL
jgi:hypothetical protein